LSLITCSALRERQSSALRRALATLAGMTAVIFHFWLGVILLAVSILAVVGLIGGYLKKVTAPQFPSKRNREE
jgi:hypothetical protein